jgi:sec-independent protein translocase protein TatC
VTNPDPEEGELDASRAPLLDHLIELRSRMIICVASLFVGFILCFAFADRIYFFLLHPYEVAAGMMAAQKAGGGHAGPLDMLMVLVGARDAPAVEGGSLRVVFTAPLEFFIAKIKLAGFGAVVLAFPVLAWQLYRFVAPGLYRKERNAFAPFLLAAPVLFLTGAALVYYVMMPFVLWFSLSQEIVGAGAISVELLPKVSDYLTLVTSLLLAFGLCFQLPVVLSLCGLAGLISSDTLRAGRRYAIVGVFVVAAVVTPPDPISQITLALPLILLYEISIICVWLIERRRKTEDDAAEEALPV